MKFLDLKKITSKIVLIFLTLFIFLNIFDAGFTLYAMSTYGVPELNPLVAKQMENGTFLLIKVGFITFLAGLISLSIKNMSEKQRIQLFIMFFLLVIYYIIINVSNIYFIWRNF